MSVRVAVRLGFFIFLAVARVGAQVDKTLSEREEVTAVDVVVELSTKGEPVKEISGDFSPGDFVIEEDGVPLAIVGVEKKETAEPWHVLLYFDLDLSSTLTMRRAASALADHAAELVGLGQVSVVTADPEPRQVLAPTRDAELLDQTLSGLYLKAHSANEILSLREDFLVQRENEPELSRPEVIRTLIAEESRLVGERQDALLALLVEQLPGTARRVAFLVSDGYDEHPAEFYGRYSEVGETAQRLEDMTAEWARTIAAYGWSVVVVASSETKQAKPYGAGPVVDERTWSVRTPGVTSRLDGSFDPERAAALHELGQRYAEQGKLSEAEESLREALSFYHGKPKFARQRAAVMSDLGRVLQAQDRFDTSRQVLRQAVALDPDVEKQFPFLGARMQASMAPLETLAEISTGRIVGSDEEMTAALAALGSTVRLTFQFRGDPDGRVHGLTIATRDSTLEVRGPSWVRFGTPRAVSELRARRLLAGELDREGLEVKCRFVEDSRSYADRRGTLVVSVRDLEAGAELGERRLRLTLAIAREDGSPEMLVREIVFDESPYRLPLDVTDDQVWLGLVVDDLASGLWGGASAEL